MGKLIDWYLVELEARLERRLPLESVHTVLHETRDHLESLGEQFLAAGMDPNQAEKAAVQQFGRPGWYAKRLLLSANRGQERPEWSWIVRTILVAMFGVLTLGALLASSYVHWIVTCSAAAVLVLGLPVALFTTGRVLLGSSACVFAIGGMLFAIVAGIRFTGPEVGLIPVSSASVLLETLRREHQSERESRAFTLEVEQFYAKGQELRHPKWFIEGRGWLYPVRVDGRSLRVRPFSMSMPTRYIAMDTTQDFTEARLAWRRFGSAAWVSELNQSEVISMEYALRNALNQTPLERAFSYARTYAPHLILAWLLFLTLNLATVGLRQFRALKPWIARTLSA